MVGGAWTFGWDALVAMGTLGLALFAFIQLVSFNRRERRREQPVAIAHDAGGELSRMRVYLTNEGTGTAFNVRFGVKLDRREYAVGGGQGHRYTVSPGRRLPEEGYFEVTVHVSAFVVSSKGRVSTLDVSIGRVTRTRTAGSGRQEIRPIRSGRSGSFPPRLRGARSLSAVSASAAGGMSGLWSAGPPRKSKRQSEVFS